MITPENYYGQISRINLNELPSGLVKGHEYVDKATNGGSDWSAYHSSPTIQKVIQLYFSKLAEHIPAKNEETIPEMQPGIKSEPVKKHREKTEKQPKMAKQEQEEEDENPGTPVEKVSDSVRFIKRYAALHEKTRTKEQILNFVNSLQRAILERRIRKTDPYAKEITQMQEQLVECYNKMASSITITIDKATLEKYASIGEMEYPMLSIALLKRYVGLHGKKGVKEKAKKLYKAVENALNKGHIASSDKYHERVIDMKRHLDLYISGPDQILSIEETELNGISGLGFIPAVVGAATGAIAAQMVDNMLSKKGLSGVMTSENLAAKEFETIGLKDPWLSLIGDPSPGFSMLLYGPPKSGKSTLALQFSKYLAENHGSVLYWTREEGFVYTMQEKINRVQAKHPRLFISQELPVNLSPYKFVVIDSITKAGMDHRDMATLKHRNPGISFIFIAQSTKDGKYRGSRDLEHEVDVIVKVENGEATAFGRFNQGGRMKVGF